MMIEVRFHGMGGQGAVMGALMLAEAAFSEGKYAQKIPVYGGMRRGGSVTVFLRLDNKPIRRTCGIYEPDALIILDPFLVKEEEVKMGLKEGSTVIVNHKDLEIQKEFKGVSKIAVVDATKISSEIFGQRAIPITNTVMLGAIARATDWVEFNSLIEPINEAFKDEIAEMNIAACKRGYNSVTMRELI